MNQIVSTRNVLGWTVGDAGEGEPRVRDIDLAARLGFDRPRNVRKLIERHAAHGNVNPIHVVSTVERTGAVQRTEREFWLDEADALFITAKSETAAANLITREMIRMFIEARRGAGQIDELVAALRSLLADAAAGRRLVTGARLRDNPVLANPVRRRFAFLASARRISIQRAHGMYRRQFKLPSFLDHSVFDLPVLGAWFDEQFGGRMPALPPPTTGPQLPLFGGAP